MSQTKDFRVPSSLKRLDAGLNSSIELVAQQNVNGSLASLDNYIQKLQEKRLHLLNSFNPVSQALRVSHSRPSDNYIAARQRVAENVKRKEELFRDQFKKKYGPMAAKQAEEKMRDFEQTENTFVDKYKVSLDQHRKRHLIKHLHRGLLARRCLIELDRKKSEWPIEVVRDHARSNSKSHFDQPSNNLSTLEAIEADAARVAWLEHTNKNVSNTVEIQTTRLPQVANSHGPNQNEPRSKDQKQSPILPLPRKVQKDAHKHSHTHTQKHSSTNSHFPRVKEFQT